MIFVGRNRILIFLTRRHKVYDFESGFFDADPNFVSFVTLCDISLRLMLAFPDNVARHFIIPFELEWRCAVVRDDRK